MERDEGGLEPADNVWHSVESGPTNTLHSNVALSSETPPLTSEQASSSATITASQNDHSFDRTVTTHSTSTSYVSSYFASSSAHGNIRSMSELGQQILRAEKDDIDPTESIYRRRVPLDRSGSTRTAINTLFKAPSPDPQPSPNQTSFLSPTSTEKSLLSRTFALGNHIYHAGLLEGRHSDVCVNAFGQKYKLHRLILEQAPFFASAFSGPWFESRAREIDLNPTDMDPNITQEAFELALKRLYGFSDAHAETFHCIALLPTAGWLDMPDLVNDSVETIIRTLDPTHLSPIINLVTGSYYGKAGDLILQSACILLKRHGSTIPVRCWDYISAHIVRDIVGADDFFIESEWDRWVLARKLLNRRLKLLSSTFGIDQESIASQTALMSIRRAGRTRLPRPSEDKGRVEYYDQTALHQWTTLYSHTDVESLYELLDDKINYMHFEFEDLQKIKGVRDVFGVPILRASLINEALWTSLELKRKILCADAHEAQLGLARACHAVEATDQEPDPANPALPSQREGEIGITCSRGDGHDSEYRPLSPRENYLIPRCDCNISIGANPMPRKGSEERKRARNRAGHEVDSNNVVGGGDTVESRDTESAEQKYSIFPPFRFSVEFSSAQLLGERKHIHSQTVFYAGSFWNVYIQKLRKQTKDNKLPQLGVYLRRAENCELGDVSGRQRGKHGRSVNEQIGELEREMFQQINRPIRSQAGATRSADDTSLSTNESTLFSNEYSGLTFLSSPTVETRPHLKPEILLHDSAMQHFRECSEGSEDEGIAQEPPFNPRVIPQYVDPRPLVKVYFKIFCPSPGGRSLNIWESVPDSFSLKQSRGWRSSNLMADVMPPEEPTSGGSEDTTMLDCTESARPTYGHGTAKPQTVSSGQQSHFNSSLRFSVVVGVV